MSCAMIFCTIATASTTAGATPHGSRGSTFAVSSCALSTRCWKKPPARLRIRPIDLRCGLGAATEQLLDTIAPCRHEQRLSLRLGQPTHELANRIPQQIVRVLDGSFALDRRRVLRH